jgi:hypothetical protein
MPLRHIERWAQGLQNFPFPSRGSGCGASRQIGNNRFLPSHVLLAFPHITAGHLQRRLGAVAHLVGMA